ncbi:hypothetical protein WJX84_008570 [Apatococcus fuscideae]|uniref:Uncharacterized protein n=1 Tax=Apatococcus fuscideae TaxID=2026836 RepID=A0AAW1SAE9_9CHLO
MAQPGQASVERLSSELNNIYEFAEGFAATRLFGILIHYKDWLDSSTISGSHILGARVGLSQSELQKMQSVKLDLMARLQALQQAQQAPPAAMQARIRLTETGGQNRGLRLMHAMSGGSGDKLNLPV